MSIQPQDNLETTEQKYLTGNGLINRDIETILKKIKVLDSDKPEFKKLLNEIPIKKIEEILNKIRTIFDNYLKYLRTKGISFPPDGYVPYEYEQFVNLTSPFGDNLHWDGDARRYDKVSVGVHETFVRRIRELNDLLVKSGLSYFMYYICFIDIMKISKDDVDNITTIITATNIRKYNHKNYRILLYFVEYFIFEYPIELYIFIGIYVYNHGYTFCNYSHYFNYLINRLNHFYNVFRPSEDKKNFTENSIHDTSQEKEKPILDTSQEKYSQKAKFIEKIEMLFLIINASRLKDWKKLLTEINIQNTSIVYNAAKNIIKKYYPTTTTVKGGSRKYRRKTKRPPTKRKMGRKTRKH